MTAGVVAAIFGLPMSAHPCSTRNLSQSLAISLHALVLLAVLAVPGYALASAFLAALAGPAGEAGRQTVDVSRWVGLLGNTALVCVVALGISIGIGVGVGFAVARTDLFGRRAVNAAGMLGACVPIHTAAVFTFAWLPSSQLAGSASACGVLYGLFYSPLAVIVLGAAFSRTDRDLEDVARLETGPWSVLRVATLPQSRWALIMLGVLILLLVATDFTIADALFVHTFAEEVNTQYILHHDVGGPVLTAVPLLAVIALLLLFVTTRYSIFGEHPPWHHAGLPRRFRLGSWRYVLSLLLFGVVAVVVAYPLVAALKPIGSWSRFAERAAALWPVLLRSLLFAAGGVAVIVSTSVGLAWCLSRTRRICWLVGLAVIVLLALPAPVAGISLIGLLDHQGWPGRIYDSPLVVIAAYVVRFLPVGVLLLTPAVRRVPREREAAARLDGCDWLGAQRHVYWPAALRDLPIVALVLLILCFGEAGAVKFVAAPQWETAAVQMLTRMHFGVDSNLATLAVLSVACILIPWLAIMLVLRRRTVLSG